MTDGDQHIVNMAIFDSHTYKKNDPVYTNQRYDAPKESFKFIVGLIQKRFGQTPVSILDVGCATGAFLYYAKQHLNVQSSTGVDISDEHLRLASASMPDTEFIVDDILSPKMIKEKQMDVVTCIGTLSIFDDLKQALNNLLCLVKEGGALYIYDQVNEYPVDVLMRYRRSDSMSTDPWMTGFNLRSAMTYEAIIREIDPNAEVSIIPFSMPFSLPKSSDPMRAWTMKTEENPNQLVVGTMQLLNFKVIEIKKNNLS